MIRQEHIDDFSPALKRILEMELSAGNVIDETSKGWPQEESIIIFLKRPFAKDYELTNITYLNVDDIHYWKAEYADKATKHILACKFG